MSQPIFTMTCREVFINVHSGATISIYVEVKGRHLGELKARARGRAERQIRAVFGDDMLDRGVLEAEEGGVVDEEFYSPTFELINRFEELTPEQKAAAVARQVYLPEYEEEAEETYGPSIAAPAAKILARLAWRLSEDDDRVAVFEEIYQIEEALRAAEKEIRAKNFLLHTISPLEKREKEQQRLMQMEGEISVGLWSIVQAKERLLKTLVLA